MLFINFFLSLFLFFGSVNNNQTNQIVDDQNICSYTAYTVFHYQENGCCIMEYFLTNNGTTAVSIISSANGTILTVAPGATGSVKIPVCQKTCFKIVDVNGRICFNSPCYVHGVDVGWNFCFGPEICVGLP